ncbi:hypothetical protein ACOMHN_007972 [Nucella lapillus]
MENVFWHNWQCQQQSSGECLLAQLAMSAAEQWRMSSGTTGNVSSRAVENVFRHNWLSSGKCGPPPRLRQRHCSISTSPMEHPYQPSPNTHSEAVPLFHL